MQGLNCRQVCQIVLRVLKLQLGHAVVLLLQLAVQAIDLPLKCLALLTAFANLRLQLFVMRLFIVLNDGGHRADDGRFARARIGDDEHIQAGLLVVTRVALHPDLAL